MLACQVLKAQLLDSLWALQARGSDYEDEDEEGEDEEPAAAAAGANVGKEKKRRRSQPAKSEADERPKKRTLSKTHVVRLLQARLFWTKRAL